MSDSTSIKLRDGLKDRVASIAEEDRRSANWIMNEAIERYVEQREKRAALRRELEERHEQYVAEGRLHLTQDEVVGWMSERRKNPSAPMPKLHK